MNKKLKTALFFGSGPVAAKSLELALKWLKIEAVVTKPIKKYHKDPAPVEELAKLHNLQIYYADNKQDLEILIYKVKPSSEVGLVIDFGVIISEKTINYFSKGIVNSHFSLLPEWRGADPITYSLLSGQGHTGVSMMLIDKGMDTGQLLAEKSMAINPDWDSNQLTDQLIHLSDNILNDNLSKYLEDELTPYPQDTKNKIITYSKFIHKSDGIIDTNKPATVVLREIKAYSLWPKSTLILKNGLSLVITKASLSNKELEPGEIEATRNEMHLGLRVGSIAIERLIPANKKEMDIKSFLNGYRQLLNDL